MSKNCAETVQINAEIMKNNKKKNAYREKKRNKQICKSYAQDAGEKNSQLVIYFIESEKPFPGTDIWEHGNIQQNSLATSDSK